MSPKVVCKVAEVDNARGPLDPGAAEAIVCSSLVGFSLKTSLSAPLLDLGSLMEVGERLKEVWKEAL